MPIKVKNLSFTYLPNTPNSYEALRNVSFEIEDNSFTAIVGHTGSGKSTLVQMFNSLLIPTSGEVEINDFHIVPKKKIKNVKELRKHVGLVFQFPEYQLFEETIEKDVAFGLKNHGLSEEKAIQKAHETLMELGFDETYYKRSPFDLSGGERRKVALAGILCLDPEILILDEPTAGLDPKSTKEVLDLIRKLHKQGKTIIVITHNMDIVFKYCDHAIVLKDGEVAYDGKPEHLFDNLDNDLSIEVPKIFEFLNVLKTHGISIPNDKSKTFNDILEYLSKVRGNTHE